MCDITAAYKYVLQFIIFVLVLSAGFAEIFLLQTIASRHV